MLRICARSRSATGKRFVEICCDPRDRANPSRLEQMQDLGLLAALMPEWEPTTGRVQHDIYHVYTVDQHSLYAVAWLHALGRGELQSQYPAPSQEIAAARSPVVLCLATLLHDVGKPQGSPHAEKGAALAQAIARRFSIPDEDAGRIEFVTENGRPVMREIAGSEFEVDVDLLLLAMGFVGPERGGLVEQLGVELTDRGNVQTDADRATSVPGVFAAGDMARGQSLIVWAIAEGRTAARGIDRYLMGETALPAPL
jgi:hypothetical protein